MDKIIAISIVIGLLIIGLIRILKDFLYVQDEIQSATEFINKFGEYLTSQGQDYQIYSWLIQKSPKMQDEMGGYGVASFRPPFANYMYTNYPIILNLIPEIRKELGDDSFSRNTSALREYAALVHESLLRHLGVLNDGLEYERKRLKNPIIWFTEGTSWVLLLPISIFSWVGLLRDAIVNRIARNTLFKILAGIVTLLGAMSTIMTVVVGWDVFVKTLKTLLSIP